MIFAGNRWRLYGLVAGRGFMWRVCHTGQELYTRGGSTQIAVGLFACSEGVGHACMADSFANAVCWPDGMDPSRSTLADTPAQPLED
jgi:hypothetical protein